jgi:hypothetical protein
MKQSLRLSLSDRGGSPMSIHWVGVKKGILKRLVDLLAPQQKQEADDPRARSWARAIQSLDEVPAKYRPFFDAWEPRRQPFPYSVVTPAYKSRGRGEGEHLLSIFDGCVYALDVVDGQLRTRRYCPSGITYLERASILLHSWLAIHGLDQDGAHCSTTVYFNSVGDFLMAPFIESLRPAATPATGADLAAERLRFSPLTSTHFKFMNYGKSSIRPGEKVVEVLLQPQIREQLVELFGFSLSRLVSPAHLSILTSSELILIRDDASQRWIRGSAHGAIWTYIPRKSIEAATLRPAGDGRQQLSVGLRGGAHIQALFEASQTSQLEELVRPLRL